MENNRIDQDSLPSCGCCRGHGERMELTRRNFIASAGFATVAGMSAPSFLLTNRQQSQGRQSVIRVPLCVQPVFLYESYERKTAASWRTTGGIHGEAEAENEKQRIGAELAQIQAAADFPLEVRPLVSVATADQAAALASKNHDVLLMYATRRNPRVMEALAAPGKWNLIFVRHESGPTYYMYVGVHAHFFRKGRDQFSQPGMDVNDVIVDDQDEIAWRLRALCGLKNILGKRIVAVGGPGGWGADGNEAPDMARKRWNLDIQSVSYPELGERIKQARADSGLVNRCRSEAEQYLRHDSVTLNTTGEFVQKAFLLREIFLDLLDEAKTDAITINECMSTIMPISETTACLPLALLNDAGYLAFCESDFVVIPSGILLHYVSGLPVFLCNPSFPHKGVVTVSHCTAPRRMNGKDLEPVNILTHWESDYGAAPKVEMEKGRPVTVLNPDFAGQRWLGFEGEILETPSHPLCRTQLDLRIRGDWKHLINEIRGFHWMVAYGNHLRGIEYALRKAGIDWLGLS